MFNTPDHFGIVAICFHWLIAAMVIALFALGWYMVDLTYYDALYNSLPFIHKSTGILLAMLFALKLVWKYFDPVPKPVAELKHLEVTVARLMHYTLSVLIVLIIVSGYLISTADGTGISVFDWLEVPATVVGFPEQEDTAGMVHKYLAYTLSALVALHVSAALKHHFVNHDDTLRRMLGMISQNK